jgi:hypothetical protein
MKTTMHIAFSISLWLFLSLAGCADTALTAQPDTDTHSTPPDTPTSQARVQVVNLIADSIAVDVVMDGDLVAETVGNSHGTEYAEVPILSSSVAVNDIDGTSLLAQDGMALEVDAHYTLVAWTESGQNRISSIPNSTDAPPEGAFRIRLVHVANGLGLLTARLWQGVKSTDLGLPERGQYGPLLDIPTTGEYELSLASEGWSMTVPLPPLDAGKIGNLMVAQTSAGETFCLLHFSDGTTVQFGPSAHSTRLRFANLRPNSQPVSLWVDGELHEEQVEIPGKHSSVYSYLMPGTHPQHFVEGDANDGEALIEAAPFYLELGQNFTTVLYEDDKGEPATMTVPDVSSAQTLNDTTQMQLIHAAPDLGTINVTAASTKYSNTVVHKSLFHDVAPGTVSPVAVRNDGSYRIGIDTDDDGKPEWTYDMGYFPDYGFSLYLMRDSNGLLLLGKNSTAGDIWWRGARENLAALRYLNLSSQTVAATTDTFYPEQSDVSLAASEPVGFASLLEGDHVVEVIADVSFDIDVSLDAFGQYTIVFYDDGDELAYMLLDDTQATGVSGVRVVNLAAQLGSVSASLNTTLGKKNMGSSIGFAEAGEVVQANLTDTDPSVTIEVDGNIVPSLTFSLNKAYSGPVINVFLREDAEWPYALIYAADKTLTPSYADELRCHVRVVYVADGSGNMNLTLDGEEWGTIQLLKKQAPALFGQIDYRPIFIGERTLGMSTPLSSLDLTYDFQSNQSYTVIVFGSPDALETMVMEDIDGPKGETHVRVLHAAVGVGPVALDVQETKADGPTSLADGIEYGQLTEAHVFTEGIQFTTIDSDMDGAWEWKGYGPSDAFSYTVVTRHEDKVGLIHIGPHYIMAYGEWAK